MSQSFMLNRFFSQYAANSLWLLAERFSTMGLAFVTGILIARSCGPSAFGTLSFAVGFVQLFLFFTVLGIDPVVVKELVRHPEERASIVGSSLALHLAGFMLTAAAVVTAGVWWGIPRETFRMILLILCGGFGSAMLCIAGVFEAEMKNRLTAPVNIAVNLAFFLLNLWGCRMRMPVRFFAFTNGAILLFSAAGKWWVYLRVFGQFPLFRAKAETMLRILRKSGWLIVQLLLATVAANAAYPVLRIFCPDRVIGLYAVTAKIQVCALVFSEVVAASMFPAIIRVCDQPGTFDRRLRNLYRTVFWSGAAAVLAAFWLGPPVIRLLYGAAFDDAGTVLWAAIMALPLNGLVHVFARWCVIRRHESAIVLQTLASAAAALTCVCVFGRRYGYAGAVWSIFAAAAAQWLIVPLASGDVRKHVLWIFGSLTFFGYSNSEKISSWRGRR